MKPEVQKSKRWLNAFGIALLCASFGVACGDSTNEQNETQPFPNFENENGMVADPNYKDSGLSGVETLQSWNTSVVYGEVLRVEPVTNRYEDVHEDGEWVPGTTCDGALTPALRVHLRVEEASWPVDEEETVILGLHTQRMHKPVPEMRDDRAAVSWSDGQGYFAKGARFGAVGKFDSSGIFIPDIPFFSVDAEGNVVLPKGHESDPELSGQTLNGLVSGLDMSRDEVFQEHVNDAWGKLKSACMAGNDEDEVRESHFSGIDCDAPENADLEECESA